MFFCLFFFSESNLASNTTEPILFLESLEHFENIDLNGYADKIQTRSKRSGISSVFHSIVGPPKLHKSLSSERNLIFTLALIPFDNEDRIHVRILQTLYKTLSNTKFDCARFGPHWELIGFQGKYFSLFFIKLVLCFDFQAIFPLKFI